MRFLTVAAAGALLTLLSGAAAQNVAEPTTAPAKPARAKTGPPSVVTVANASTHTAVMVIITAGDATASTSKPLAPKAKTSVKLPKLQGCTVAVAASFEGGGQVEIGEFDVCKDKTIRFTD